MKTSLALLAALGLALPALPAAAQTQSVTIVYKDLNLASAEGQAALERRIEKAARAACGANDVTSGTRLKDGKTRNCVAAAKQEAEAQLAAIMRNQSARG